MSWSWFQTFITPFVVVTGGEFWHDTIAMVIPPTEVPIDISYTPDPKFKSLIIGLTFGDAYEYNPDTGEIGPEIYSTDIGVYHACRGWMAWHWDPFVKSILKTNPYPQLGWCSKDKPYILRVINKTNKHVWTEVTFWVIKFPTKVYFNGREWDPEELFRIYMHGIVRLFVEIGKWPSLSEFVREVIK